MRSPILQRPRTTTLPNIELGAGAPGLEAKSSGKPAKRPMGGVEDTEVEGGQVGYNHLSFGDATTGRGECCGGCDGAAGERIVAEVRKLMEGSGVGEMAKRTCANDNLHSNGKEQVEYASGGTQVDMTELGESADNGRVEEIVEQIRGTMTSQQAVELFGEDWPERGSQKTKMSNRTIFTSAACRAVIPDGEA